jgi:hypothetical protein
MVVTADGVVAGCAAALAERPAPTIARIATARIAQIALAQVRVLGMMSLSSLVAGVYDTCCPASGEDACHITGAVHSDGNGGGDDLAVGGQRGLFPVSQARDRRIRAELALEPSTIMPVA